MKRVYAYKNAGEEDGKVVVVEDSMESFKTDLKNLFELEEENNKIYLANGCEITDIRVIRDEENIYLSTGGLKGGKVCDVAENFDEILSFEDRQTNSVSDWITLNVGGRHFTTSRSTLWAKEPSSMLARMFADVNNEYIMNPSMTDEKGAFLIDRSPRYFEPILNYLRHGVIVLDGHVNPRGVLEEAIFYGIESMIPQLNKMVNECEYNSDSNRPLTRMEVVQAIVKTPTDSELRFQGVNLEGADLNKLDLRCINFKYACLSKCNLSGANLSHCCLERADLTNANMEGVQMLGVKALCANFEGANLKSCNMEDPAGLRAILEGVNLKGCNLEGSNMAGVNLRVATLKNANLQNCDLRTAVLAGADLESCDLSGSDLHEANLRGANLKDAAFELMLTPLHMSQTIR